MKKFIAGFLFIVIAVCFGAYFSSAANSMIIGPQTPFGSSGGGATPGGVSGNVQYNNGGALAGIPLSSVAGDTVTYSGVVVSTYSLGNTLVYTSLDTSDGANMYIMTFTPNLTYTNRHWIQFIPASTTTPLLNLDGENQRVCVNTNSCSHSFEVNGAGAVSGTFQTQGLFVPSSGAPFNYQGNVVLVSGKANVANQVVASNSHIYLTDQVPAAPANIGIVYVSSVTAGTSFNIQSTVVTDTSTVSWLLVGD